MIVVRYAGDIVVGFERKNLLNRVSTADICDSTSPPISSSLVESRFSAASNWLERCLSDIFPLFALCTARRL